MTQPRAHATASHSGRNMAYRISVDTGGTFTDVVVVDGDGTLHIGKALTTYARAFEGIEQALGEIADELGVVSARAAGATRRMFTYGTTRATNAIVEAQDGAHRVLHDGGLPGHPAPARGRASSSRFRQMPYPPPYVPRFLTFEIDERIDSDGSVHVPLDEESASATRSTLPALQGRRRSASACCGRPSTRRTNCAIGELISEHAARRRPVHALAPAQPDRARVPARVLHRHRRLAEAADAGRSSRDSSTTSVPAGSPVSCSSRRRSADRGAASR